MNKPSDTLARLRARTVEAGRFVLPLDPVWAEKVVSAHTALRNLEQYGDPDDPDRARRVVEAKAELDSLTADVEGEVMVFKFRRLSRAAYDAIVTRNPATAEQIEKAKLEGGLAGRTLVWNPETFPVDLLDTVLIDPKLPRSELEEMLNGHEDPEAEVLLSKGEAESILASAMQTALSVPPAVPRELTLP